MLVATSAHAQGPGGEMPPTQVEAAKPRVESISETLAAVGTLRADEAVVIRPEVAGRIENVLFDEGQKVELAFAIDLGAITKLHRRSAIVAHVSGGGTGLVMESYAAR